MKTYELDFGLIHILEEDIAEIVINEGVELKLETATEIHEFLLSHLIAPYSLIVNKVNSYTYDYQAQLKLISIEQLKAVAIISYSTISKVSSETMINLKKSEKPYFKVFEKRKDAQEWLQQKRSSN